MTDESAGTPTIEVSHEALIREWKRLADWLYEAREDVHLQQTISQDVTEWEQHNKPKDRLYRGSQFKVAQGWATRNVPSQKEVTFLKASAFQRTLSLVRLIAVALVLISALGVTGWFVFTTPPSPTLVTTLQDNVAGSLRYCITNAPSGSTIRFAQDMRGTIVLGGDLTFMSNKRLTIAGPGANQLTISNGNSNAVIRVPDGAALNISGLSFKNSVTHIYAFLSNQGTVRMTNSIISNNQETVNGVAYGGGIYNYDTGNLTLINSTVSDNTAQSTSSTSSAQGGGIENSGTLAVINSTISGNTAVADGGGKGLGGGIYNYTTGTVTVTNSTISGNTAHSSNNNASGGGIRNDGKLTVSNSIIQDNKAVTNGGTSFGGGIFNGDTGIVTVMSSTISRNTSSSTGTSNSNNGQGGGIDNQGKLTVTESTFSNNTTSGDSSFGGGIYNYQTGTILVTSSTILANKAIGKQGGQGGGIDNEGKLTVTESTFSNNTANGGNDFGGGGISFVGLKGSSTTIRFCTFYGNTSSAGGGIWVDPTGSSAMTISSTIVVANSAHDGPDISGTLTSGGYNLLQNFAGAKGLNATTDRQVTLADLKIDPTLRNNGGPTQTLALLPGSPAIDAVPGNACRITFTDLSGHPVTITTDQRGDARPDGSEETCDIGAYESSY